MITRHLLWSGGWDSTFRLLYVLLVRGEKVQPHYIIRLPRKSTDRELKTQATVRMRLAREFPKVAANLLPTKMMESSLIPVEPTVQAQFERLRRFPFLNAAQYEEISYYAAQLGVGQSHPLLEVGFVREGTIHKAFREELERVTIDGEPQFWFRRQLKDPDLGFFHYFSFPILFYTKEEMGEVARSHGFANLLHESWFCHNPLLGRIQCGVCPPCLDAREQGMGYRLHPLTHVRYYVRKYVTAPLYHWRRPKPVASTQIRGKYKYMG